MYLIGTMDGRLTQMFAYSSGCFFSSVPVSVSLSFDFRVQTTDENSPFYHHMKAARPLCKTYGGALCFKDLALALHPP
jgi:hypothetical protein